MAGIYFRERETKQHLDASFHLYESYVALGDVSTWYVGDIVGVCFDEQAEVIQQIAKHCPSGFNCPASGSFLQVPCSVVSRHHSIVWKKIGHFLELTTCDVTLEAENAWWEDVLKWVVLNRIPEWIVASTAISADLD